ncbi:hypothetical protein MPTK1_4g05460 [Marchantia polymorpha subsp. ruderalis]|uniref:Uncharacterized protein n=3 Tax=Marchantia polymorpha TaxID=3197 RepID=A0AAF6B6N2_MARPO|nr:hypothetical protein MARPO_0087s0044 [Marchantia polymorpha]BBN07666.1 hypothetical protein Mp_4g05460 [Marchantia polymorpha subsp. ruderalis]|eukprot:PTQ33606.1 hypothetical protein MARPO_0087s0044 [Marchantia polymorpha]
MGSLTAGWSTNPPCEKKVLKRSTSSMTRSQVNRYWRAKRSLNKEHLEEAHRAASIARTRSLFSEITEENSEEYYPDMQSEGGSVGGSTSGSTPTTPRRYDREEESNKPGWWRKSNWAFLNEPPLHEEKHYSYAPQYEIDVRAKATEIEGPPKRQLHHTRSSLSIY